MNKHRFNVFMVEYIFYIGGTIIFPILLLCELIMGKDAWEGWFNSKICAPLNNWADGVKE